jgi:PelA/Pel-15E family pectate lyase
MSYSAFLTHGVQKFIVVSMLTALSPPARAVDSVARYLRQPDAWYAGEEARQIAYHVVANQTPLGGWPKNVDTTVPLAHDEPLQATFDNRATTDELRFLARMLHAGNNDQYRTALHKGIDYILSAQYPTGGWPQLYPPGKKYHRHITFNDGAMVRLLEYLRDASQDDLYVFVDSEKRAAAQRAFDRGIECILRCQIVVDGKLTAWCAQHDELDYAPRPGRAFELASLSGSESVGIVRLLMRLDPPSPEVARAVDAAVAWFKSVKIDGIKIVDNNLTARTAGERQRELVADPGSPGVWARFYELKSSRPLYANRNGIATYRFAATTRGSVGGRKSCWRQSTPIGDADMRRPRMMTNAFAPSDNAEFGQSRYRGRLK